MCGLVVRLCKDAYAFKCQPGNERVAVDALLVASDDMFHFFTQVFVHHRQTDSFMLECSL